MLVLLRKPGEAVMVGDVGTVLKGPIKVSVQRIGNNSVRIGFEADDGVPIHREEIWIEIQQEKGGE